MKARKDKKGRVLRRGESYREDKQLYEYRYTDPFKKRKSIYAKDLAKLREKEDELIKDRLDGIDAYVAGNVDLNYMFDRYMATKSELRTSTRSNYLEIYDRYVREGFGKRTLSSIKYSDILFFYIQLITGKNLHIGTIEYLQRIIRPSLEMAVRDNIIRTNPADKIIQQLKKKTQTGTNYVRHALTIEQQRVFIGFLNDYQMYDRWRPIFTVMLGTGCRIGELIGLRWEDVDMDARTISINHSLFYFAGKRNKSESKWIVNEPKTEAGIREIPMVETVYMTLLEEYARQRDENLSCKTTIGDMSGFIFFNRFREVHNPESINRQLTRIIETYNSMEEVNAAREKRKEVLLPHFTCHHLRHTFCTRLCEADVNIKVIQQVMGHKDIQTTLDIYAEVGKEKKKTALEDVFEQMKLF